nr:hypothetical protein [Candidatus Sigynarchaeota archaeon]
MKSSGSIIVVDTLNILFQNSGRKARVQNFTIIKQAIARKFPGATIYFLADASTRHKIDDVKAYEALCANGDIIQTPAGEPADYYLITYASSKPECLIISCDAFRDHDISASLRRRVIPAVIIGTDVIFSPKLETCLCNKEESKAAKVTRAIPALVQHS